MLWNCGERLDRSATPMRHGPCDIAARFALTQNHVHARRRERPRRKGASQNKLGRISTLVSAGLACNGKVEILAILGALPFV